MRCLWQRGMFRIIEVTIQERKLSQMLKENLKTIRKAKGLSQEELAIKLNVVRQTISKWEQGLSVPDSEMLLTISEVLETPVSTLLGETVSEAQADDLKVIAEKLEVINLQLAQRNTSRRKILNWICISICVFTVITLFILFLLGSPYLKWDYSNAEWAVVGTIFHGFEFIFVRVAPFVFIGSLVGAILTRKKQ